MTLRAILRRVRRWMTTEPDTDRVSESTLKSVREQAARREYLASLETRGLREKPKVETPEPTPRDALSKPWGQR